MTLSLALPRNTKTFSPMDFTDLSAVVNIGRAVTEAVGFFVKRVRAMGDDAGGLADKALEATRDIGRVAQSGMTDQDMEVIEATVGRIGETVQSVRSKVNHLAILPGGEIAESTARQLDNTATKANDLLASIDFELAIMVAVLKHLP